MNAPALTVSELFCRAGIERLVPREAAIRATPLTGLAMDSRRVRPGDAFLAVAGYATNGRRFIADAVARGAAVVFVAGGVRAVDRAAVGAVPICAVDELPRHLGRLASAWYDDPSRALRVLGVTGTNGKTSCTHHLAELLSALNERAGLCGTLGNGFPGALQNTGLTTADVMTLTASLARMRDEGAQWVAMEVSSHALDQERTAGIRFAGALLTNLTRDHLDYHSSMAAYGEAKRQLFLSPGLEVGVLNRDDPFARSLSARIPTAVEVFDYSLTDHRASLRVRERHLESGRTVAGIESIWGSGRLSTALIGDFLLSNLLGALTLLAGLGLPFAELLAAAAQVRPVGGRLQPIMHPRGFTCVVDYAHTPDALAHALTALRCHFPGRVFCVFGCGGERDSGKRALMGEAATASADRIVITDDNPRGEDGDAIAAQIAAGVGGAVPTTVERDRAAAIALACAEAAQGDVVLIAGKGHEDYQDGAGGCVPYSDVAVVQQLVREAVREEVRCCSG